MDVKIGTVDISQESILHGDHHIIVAGTLAASLESLKAGMVLKEVSAGGGVYTPATGDAVETVLTDSGSDTTTISETERACAVLLENIDDSDDVDVAEICVHGAVRRDKLLMSDGETEATAAIIAALRENGIYAA